MGLDSCVKKYLRQHANAAFHYHKDMKSVYSENFDALIVDMNVELFRKPEACRTGLDWAKYVYNSRIKRPQVKVVVLLFDSSPLVPAVKDLCHLSRSTNKRKRGFIPLPKDTLFSDTAILPDWRRVTGTKGLLPKVWQYLTTALRRLIEQDIQFEKTVYFDTPLCPQLSSCKDMSGNINLVWRANKNEAIKKPPQHRYGEGDLKTRAWVHHLLYSWELKKILILSTDLDNIPIFARPEFVGVHLMANAVYRNDNGIVAPKPKNTTKSLEYEIISLGNISTILKQNWSLFINILTLCKNDFNENIHKITTERMLKTFFGFIKASSCFSLKSDEILDNPKEYAKLVSMTQSRIIHKRSSNIPVCSNNQVNNFLARGKWIRSYWDGEEAYKGGPDCTQSKGWKRPRTDVSLQEYSGRVRLVPA